MADLLSDAIADAKRVKSTALANAKIALEETFQPTLRNMISAKLSEEEGDEELDDIDIDINYGDEPELGGEEPAEEEGGEGFDSFSDEEAPVEEPAEEGEEDLEMEALLRELEGEDYEEDEPVMEGEEDEWQDPVPDEDVDPVMEGEEMDDMELEEALDALLREEDGDLGDIDGPNKEDGASFTETPPSGDRFLEVRRLRKENANLKKQYNNALRAVTTYKTTINEVNLLNAKLMYTTKTLRQFTLNENQQVRILENFDRAQSVREVKLVYATIVEAFNKKSPAKKKVNEGLSSKTVKAINPKRKLNEGSGDIVNNSMVDRFQILAGMKRDAY